MITPYNHDNFNHSDLTYGYRVYRNLHNHLYSIQGYIPGKGWRVIAHGDNFLGWDVRFVVNEAGRQRVLASGHKNVHAYAILGRLTANVPECFVPEDPYPIYYDPRAPLPLGAAQGSFAIDGPDLAISRADAVWFTNGLLGLRPADPTPLADVADKMGFPNMPTTEGVI